MRQQAALWELTPQWDYIVGDATDAYGGRLTRYRRHVAFVKPDVIVIYDDLVAKEPGTFQFMLHALSPFTVNEADAALKVERPKAGLLAKYLSPVPLKFRQWDGYTPPPNREFPNQWHVEAGTQETQREIGMLTVLVPHKAGQQRDWTVKRMESSTAVGVRFERGATKHFIAFRKSGVTGEASLEGFSFTRNAIVR